MQDGWKLQPDASDHATFPVYADGSQLSLMSPGDFAYLMVYSEYLNASTSDSYDLDVYLNYDTNLQAGNLDNNFSRKSIAAEFSSIFPRSDALNVSLYLSDFASKEIIVIPNGPTLNAIEIYSQITYNFSSTNDDDCTFLIDMAPSLSTQMHVLSSHSIPFQLRNAVTVNECMRLYGVTEYSDFFTAHPSCVQTKLSRI